MLWVALNILTVFACVIIYYDVQQTIEQIDIWLIKLLDYRIYTILKILGQQIDVHNRQCITFFSTAYFNQYYCYRRQTVTEKYTVIWNRKYMP